MGLINRFLLYLKILFVLGCSNLTGTDSIPFDDSKLCIPKSELLALSPAHSDKHYDSDEGVYEALSFSWQSMQEAVPEYIGQTRTKNGTQYYPLHVTITEFKAYELPAFPADAYQIDQRVPELIGAKTEKILAWDVLRGRSDNYTFWGDCTFINFKRTGPVSCNRRLSVHGLNLDYIIHQDNLHLYSQIDQFLLSRFKTWRCK